MSQDKITTYSKYYMGVYCNVPSVGNVTCRPYITNVVRTRKEDTLNKYAETTDTFKFDIILWFEYTGTDTAKTITGTYTVWVNSTPHKFDYNWTLYKGTVTSGIGQSYGGQVPESVGYPNKRTIELPGICPMESKNVQIEFSMTINGTAISRKTLETYNTSSLAGQIGISTIDVQKTKDSVDTNLNAGKLNTITVHATVGKDGAGGNFAQSTHIYWSTDGKDPYPAAGWPYSAFSMGNGGEDSDTYDFVVDKSCTLKLRPYTTSTKYDNTKSWNPSYKYIRHPAGETMSVKMTFNNRPSYDEDAEASLECLQSRATASARYKMIWPPAIPYRLKGITHTVAGYKVLIKALRGDIEQLLITEDLTGLGISMDGLHVFTFSNDSLTNKMQAGDTILCEIQPYAKVYESGAERKCYGPILTTNTIEIVEDGGYAIINTETNATTGELVQEEGLVYVYASSKDKKARGWQKSAELYVLEHNEIEVKDVLLESEKLYSSCHTQFGYDFKYTKDGTLEVFPKYWTDDTGGPVRVRCTVTIGNIPIQSEGYIVLDTDTKGKWTYLSSDVYKQTIDPSEWKPDKQLNFTVSMDVQTKPGRTWVAYDTPTSSESHSPLKWISAV